MRLRYKKFISLFIFLILLIPLFVLADPPPDRAGGTGNPPGSDIPKITNPLGGEFDPRVILGRVTGAALGVIGSIALVIFIWGGFTWMTSGGSQDKVKKGKDMLLWASLGLGIIFLSYALVKFIFTAVTTSPADVGDDVEAYEEL